MPARVKAESFFKDSGKKTEGALKDVGDSMNALFSGAQESFSSIKFMGARPASSWFGAVANTGALEAPPELPSKGSSPTAAARPAGRQPERQAHAEDDHAMRRHCAALERLVDVGLSPQAARVALRHLDEWLVGQEGEVVMASAEAAAHCNGEAILHIGDRVRLEGLVKNVAVNGMIGTLQAYSAESLRWKVMLNDNQVFWVRPKLIQPLEIRRRSLPTDVEASGNSAGSAGSVGGEGEAQAALAAAAEAVASGMAKMEAQQQKWKEEREAHEIKLLEREESLRKLQEAIQAGADHTPLAASPSAAQFLMGGDESPESEKKQRSGADANTTSPTAASGGSAEAEEDEMWDMDWTAVSPERAIDSGTSNEEVAGLAGGSVGSSCSTAPGTRPAEVLQRGLGAPAPAAEASVPEAPNMAPEEREVFQHKMEEKRRLADLHNGQDMTAPHIAEFNKGRMPGANAEIALKLEQRRRKLEEAGNELPPETS